MSEYAVIEFQNCTPESKKKLLFYLMLNRYWWRPSQLAGNMSGVHWNSDYQLKKALNQLLASGEVECKLVERGHFRYYAYRAVKEISLEEYRTEYPK